MGLQLYTKATVFIDSKLLTEHWWLQVRRTDNRSLLSVSSNVPVEGLELDVGSNIRDSKPVLVEIFAAGKVLTFKANVTSDEFRHDCVEGAKATAHFEGPFTQWEPPTEAQSKMLAESTLIGGVPKSPPSRKADVFVNGDLLMKDADVIERKAPPPKKAKEKKPE